MSKRKRGRQEPLSLRIDDELKAKLKRKARAEGRTLSGFARYVLERAVAEPAAVAA